MPKPNFLQLFKVALAACTTMFSFQTTSDFYVRSDLNISDIGNYPFGTDVPCHYPIWRIDHLTNQDFPKAYHFAMRSSLSSQPISEVIPPIGNKCGTVQIDGGGMGGILLHWIPCNWVDMPLHR